MVGFIRVGIHISISGLQWEMVGMNYCQDYTNIVMRVIRELKV